MSENYSDEYRAQMATALIESKNVGFSLPPFIDVFQPVSAEVLKTANEIVDQASNFLSMAVPGYWGNACQTLSSNLFAYLNAFGVSADIVLGTVIINGTDEYDTTLEGLKGELKSPHRLSGPQTVHAWVTIGDDTVIDAALPPRLVKNYKAPERFNDMMFITRAGFLYDQYNIQYRPVLVGSEFFARTNPPDPMVMLEHLKGMLGQRKTS